MIIILERIENMFKTEQRPAGYQCYLVKCSKCWKEYPMIKYDLWKTEYCTTCANRIKAGVKWWEEKHISWKGTHFYQKWQNMVLRCNYKTIHWYKNYWGRGIKCEWNNFEEFKNDMYSSYLLHFKKHWYDTTLDRIDVNGNYNKDNCRWLTMKEQQSWKRNSIKTIYNGKEYPTLKSLCKEYWKKYRTVFWRVKRGIPIEKAILSQ